MFGKLVKYEMKSILKVFTGLWIAVLVVATISGITLNLNVGERGDNFFFPQLFTNDSLAALMEVIPLIVYFALAVAIVALSVVFVIQRFYSGLFGNEGYLMNTLPASPRTLISAKGFASTVIVTVSGIVGALSVLLFSIPVIRVKEVTAVFGAIKEVIVQYPSIVLLGIFAIVLGIISIVNCIYHIYAAIALGHLFQKHRMLMAVVAFIAIAIIEDIIQTAGIFALSRIDGIEKFMGEITINDVSGVVNYDPKIFILFGAIALVGIIGIIIFHAITECVMRYRLNLE